MSKPVNNKPINKKPTNSFPMETTSHATVARRVKKDLAWVIVSVALALAAAAVTYLLIKPA